MCHSCILSPFTLLHSHTFLSFFSQVTASVLYVIHLSIPLHWYTFVMNAIMVRSRDDVACVVESESRMPTIVENVSNKKRIEMDVPKLSIWEPRKRIYFMNEKSMALKSDSTKREGECMYVCYTGGAMYTYACGAVKDKVKRGCCMV